MPERPLLLLVEDHRVGCAQCPRCAQAQPSRAHQDQSRLAVGDVVGPVIIIALDQPLSRQVRWACCGAEEALSIKRIHQLKHRARYVLQQLCDECNRKRPRPRYMGPWMQATAMLPPGIIPAGAAWPRPGVGT